jgi:hypothetical protein
MCDRRRPRHLARRNDVSDAEMSMSMCALDSALDRDVMDAAHTKTRPRGRKASRSSVTNHVMALHGHRHSHLQQYCETPTSMQRRVRTSVSKIPSAYPRCAPRAGVCRCARRAWILSIPRVSVSKLHKVRGICTYCVCIALTSIVSRHLLASAVGATVGTSQRRRSLTSASRDDTRRRFERHVRYAPTMRKVTSSGDMMCEHTRHRERAPVILAALAPRCGPLLLSASP